MKSLFLFNALCLFVGSFAVEVVAVGSDSVGSSSHPLPHQQQQRFSLFRRRRLGFSPRNSSSDSSFSSRSVGSTPPKTTSLPLLLVTAGGALPPNDDRTRTATPITTGTTAHATLSLATTATTTSSTEPEIRPSGSGSDLVAVLSREKMVIVNTLLLSLWKKCRSGSSSSNNNYAGVAISKEEKEEEKQPLTLAAAAGGTVILLAMFALLYVAVEVIKEIVLQRNVKLLLWVAATRLLVDLFFRKQHPKKTDESSNNNNEDSTTGTSSSLKQATHIDDKSNATASAATLFLKEDTASLVLSRTSGNERCEVGFETKEEKMDTDARKEDTEAAAAAMVVLPKDPNHAAPRSLFVSFGILFQNLQSALSGIVVRRRGGQPSAFESASGHDEMSITQTWTSSSITTNPKPQEKSKQLQSPDWQSFAMTMPPVSSNKNKWGIFGTSRGTIPVPKLSTAVVLLEGVAVAASAALLVAAFAAGLPVWLCDTAAALLTWSLGSSVYDKIVQVWGWRSSTRRDPSFSLTLEETMERLRETALWNSYTTTATIGNLTTTSTKQQSFYPGNQMLLQKPQLAWETIVQFVVAQGGSRDREETHTLNTPQVLETSMMTTSPSALAAAKNKNKNHAQFLTVEVTAPTCSNTTASYDSSLDTDYADVSVVQTQYYLEQPVRLLRAIVGGAFASPPPTRSNATAANETTTSSPDPASDNGSDDRL